MTFKSYLKEQRHLTHLTIFVMVSISLVIVLLTLWLLYRAQVTSNIKHLQGMVENEARMIEIVIQSNSSSIKTSIETDDQINQITKNFVYFGTTGEFVLGKRENDDIRFLSQFRFPTAKQVVSINSHLAKPMQLALENKKGWIKDLDYRGQEVIAAYHPIEAYNLGLVAKIDVDEINKPFISTALTIVFVTIILITAGILLIIRKINPILNDILESQSNIKTLIDSAPDALIIVNNNSEIMMVNHQFQSVFGYAKQEIIGQSIEVLLPTRFRQHHMSNVTSYFNNPAVREMGSGLELFALQKSGTEFPAEISLSPMSINENIFVVASIRDISERKKIERQIIHTQKIDALGKLSGGIAHDFNNILAIVNGFAMMLDKKTKDSETLNHYSQEIISAGLRGAQLIKRLLVLANTKNKTPTWVNINTTLKDNYEVLNCVNSAHIKLELSSDDWYSFINEAELLDIYLYLIIRIAQVAKLNESLLTIKIQTYNHLLDDEQASKLDLDIGHYIQINIIAEGEITKGDDMKLKLETSQSIEEHISDNKFNVIKQFIKKVEGKFIISSQNNHSLYYSLYIPSTNSNKTALPLKSHQQELREGNEHILLVDDEGALLTLMELILSDNGYQVTKATSGSEAQKLMGIHKFDLLLSDVCMPDMSGFELANYVEQKYPEVKIQLMSGFVDLEQFPMTDNIYYQQMLHKPVESNDLLIRLRELLNT